MSLVESGDVHFCQSNGHDNRCTTTIMGHTENKLGRGYDRDLTPFGKASILELQDCLITNALLYYATTKYIVKAL